MALRAKWGSREGSEGRKSNRPLGVASLRAGRSGVQYPWQLPTLAAPLSLPLARVHEPQTPAANSPGPEPSVTRALSGGPACSLLGTPRRMGSRAPECRPSPRHTTANGGPAAPARARRALRPVLATPRGPGRTLGGLAGRSAGSAPQESPRRGRAA